MLFILVMDALSKMMDRALGGGFLRGFSVPIGVLSARRVSHLLFAGDTLVFCDADMDQLTYLKQVMQWFQLVSRLKINIGKCEIFPVGEVANIDALSYVLRCKVSSLPTTYLGLPLDASYKDTTVWNPVIERVEKRLAGWQKRYLSKGGAHQKHFIEYAPLLLIPVASTGEHHRKIGATSKELSLGCGGWN
nr:uncharacterized protein LOC117274955 [Nicotiana tomentosiformis]